MLRRSVAVRAPVAVNYGVPVARTAEEVAPVALPISARRCAITVAPRALQLLRPVTLRARPPYTTATLHLTIFVAPVAADPPVAVTLAALLAPRPFTSLALGVPCRNATDPAHVLRTPAALRARQRPRAVALLLLVVRNRIVTSLRRGRTKVG